jgi:hypothetical protein
LQTHRFEPIVFQVRDSHQQIIKQFATGLDTPQVKSARQRYGDCQIVVPRKSLPGLLVDEVLNPFYLFQVFSMCLWFWDGYVNYAICILVISLAGVIENLYETVHNINSIRKLAHF